MIQRRVPGELMALVLDGERIDSARTAFVPLERGLLYGDGLFETMGVELGVAAGADRHYARLADSARELGLPVPTRAAWERGLALALGAPTLAHAAGAPCAVRVTWTRGASRRRGFPPPEEIGPPRLLVAAYAPAGEGEEALAEGCSAAIVRGMAPGDLARHKTLSALAYVVAATRARTLGADEALLVDGHDRLLEAAGSNVFVHTPGVGLRTPPLSRPILPGITRAQVLSWLPEAREADVTVRELMAADEVFLTNSVRGIEPVDSIDGRPLPRVGNGAHAHEAQKAFLAWQYESCLAVAEAAHRAR